MASLTHVCMWDKKGWRKITAKEASRLHPGGTVSAQSGLFMCELCGQYVSLTDGSINIRYFKHSRAEKSKDCPERTFGTGYRVEVNLTKYDLPLKIVNIKSNDFSFEIGFIKVPDILYTRKYNVTITNSQHTEKFTYTNERFSIGQINYMSIGSNPSSEYNIYASDPELHRFWPKIVSGIDSEGTVFDKETGKKLSKDSDVTVRKKYYILTNKILSTHSISSVNITAISKKVIGFNTWRVYEVWAKDYDRGSASFFLDYHCRLTETPISITPVWPICIVEPYVIKHNSNMVSLYITGNANTSVFPVARMSNYPCGSDKVANVSCNNRQQLISTGRTSVLNYTYFWRDYLNQLPPQPTFTITDIRGNTISPGFIPVLPLRNTIVIRSSFDGMVVRERNGRIVEKRKIQSGVNTDIDEIVIGTQIHFYVGKDKVWSALFSKEESKSTINDIELLRQLKSMRGNEIATPSSIGTIVEALVDYPNIRDWISMCVRKGSISANAYQKIKQLIVEKYNHKGE